MRRQPLSLPNMISMRLRIVAALVIADGLAARLPARDAWANFLVVKHIPEQVCVISLICDEPFGGGPAEPPRQCSR